MITIVLSRYGHEREVEVKDFAAVKELMRIYGRPAVRNTKGGPYFFPEERERERARNIQYDAARNAKARKIRAK